MIVERFFLKYGNEQKPVPDFDGKYQKGQANSAILSANHLVQGYVDSVMQGDLYHTDGGAESFDDWLKSGLTTISTGHGRSTGVSVNFKFAQPFAEVCSIK